jgi:YidC/Oxa1 family membrane protein insertase
MDRNSLIGFALVAAIMITWFTFFQPEPEDLNQKPLVEEATPADPSASEDPGAIREIPDTTAILSDSLANENLKDLYGSFAPVAAGAENITEARTDLLDLRFSSKGGRLIAAYLNEFKTFNDKPLPVIDANDANRFNLTFAHGNRTINTEDLYFTLHTNEDTLVRYRAEVAPGRYLDMVYTFRNGRYDIGFRSEFVQLSDLIRNKHVEFTWDLAVPRTEKAIENMRNQSTIFYLNSDEVESLNAASTETETENIKTQTNWVAYKNQFFSAVLIPETPFEEIKIECSLPETDTLSKIMKGVFHVPAAFKGNESLGFRLYLGPNEYYALKSYDLELDKMISLGWSFISYINKFIVLPTFKFLEGHIASYGIIILILALLIRIIVFPFAIKSYVSMAKMRIVNESQDVKDLEEKYKNDNTKLQTEKMAYYSSVGVSPLSGCLPLLFQMPIILAMFSFFPASIELRQQPFLWAEDLSSYDSVLDLSFNIPFYGSHVSLFTLLMTLSTIAFTYVSQKTQGSTNPQMKQLQWMGYVMPVIFLGILNNYASGLSYYYFVANVLSITQSYIIKASINDKKLLDQLHAYKQKKKSGNAPKSRLQKWMEEQQKKQQALQKELKNRKK